MSEWIPVIERLPKNNEKVLGCFGGQIDIVRFEAGISKETREKMKKGEIDDPTERGWCLSEGWFDVKRSNTYERCDENGNNLKPYCWVHEPMIYFGQNCDAWMELPKPYKK